MNCRDIFLFLIIFCGLLFLTVSESSAEIFKWKDDQGKWHFTDSAENIPMQFRKGLLPNDPPDSEEPRPPSTPHPPGHSPSINVSISRNGFEPVKMVIGGSWNTATQLSDAPPPGLRGEPKYRGRSQKYGQILLGTKKEKTYHFVLDLIPSSNPVLYFDLNRNGNLADDGPPLTNQGSGFFATEIRIPFHQLVDDVELPGDYAAWFFTNDSLWEKGKVAHYTRTELKGTVTIDGTNYLAYISETGMNDADFTNDGIYIDLDQNGEIDKKKEKFPANKAARIDAKSYEILIDW
ncbi:MAG: DUF4124 domain-containing protein [Nitrospinales bacterium]